MFGREGRTTSHNDSAYDAEGKRVRSSFPNSMAAHVWAQQRQSFGKSGNGNFYFHGPALYSYGSHFVVGFVIAAPNKAGGVVLLNADSSSISTSGHKTDAWRAVRHYAGQFRIPGLTELTCDAWAPVQVLLKPDVEPVNGAPIAERKEFARKAIVQHVRQCSQAIEPEAGAYLLTFAGVKNAAAKFERLKAEKAREIEAEKACEVREQFESQLSDAKKFAKATAPELADWIKRNSDQWNPIGNLKRQSTKVYHAHRAAKAKGWSQIAARVWQVQKTVRGAIAAIERKEKAKERNKWISGLVSNFRDYAAKFAANNDGLTSYHFGQFAFAAEVLAKQAKGLRPATREALAAIPAELAPHNARAIAREEAERLAREAERFAKEKAKREAWLAGESVSGYVRFSDAQGGAMLRAVGIVRDESGEVTGGTIQTSWGADVPAVHAVKAFRFIKLCRESGKGWQANGHSIPVGHFRVQSIDSAGNFVAGCHRFYWPEIERMARTLGVFDAAPDKSALVDSHA